MNSFLNYPCRFHSPRLQDLSSGYWVLVVHFTRREAIKQIEVLQHVATNLGRSEYFILRLLGQLPQQASLSSRKAGMRSELVLIAVSLRFWSVFTPGVCRKSVK